MATKESGTQESKRLPQRKRRKNRRYYTTSGTDSSSDESILAAASTKKKALNSIVLECDTGAGTEIEGHLNAFGTAILNKILGRLSDISTQVKQQTTTCNRLAALISNNEIRSDLVFPLKCVADLDEIEEKLKDADIFNLLVKELSFIGRAGVREGVARCLRHLMTDECAAGINWKGNGEKRALSDSSIFRAIAEATKKNNGMVERRQIEDMAKNWLKNAPTRLKRRRVS